MIVLVKNSSALPTTGNFAGLPEGAVVSINGLFYSITYAYNADGDGVNNDVALIDLPPQHLNLYWDADGAGSGTGGTGAWDTSTPLWRVGNSISGQLVAWSNLDGDIAVFPVGAGTVTLGTGITASGLQFQDTGYIVTGNTLTIGGGNIDVANGGHRLDQPRSSPARPASRTSSSTARSVLSASNTFTGGRHDQCRHVAQLGNAETSSNSTVGSQNAVAFGPNSTGVLEPERPPHDRRQPHDRCAAVEHASPCRTATRQLGVGNAGITIGSAPRT